MGSRPAILTLFPQCPHHLHTDPSLLLLSPGLSSEGKLCAVGCGPEVCGQGCLALPSSGPISPSQGLERVKAWGEVWSCTPGF